MNNLYLTVQLDRNFRPCKRNLVVAKSREQARYLAYTKTRKSQFNMVTEMPNFSVKLIKKNIWDDARVVSKSKKFKWAWDY